MPRSVLLKTPFKTKGVNAIETFRFSVPIEAHRCTPSVPGNTKHVEIKKRAAAAISNERDATNSAYFFIKRNPAIPMMAPIILGKNAVIGTLTCPAENAEITKARMGERITKKTTKPSEKESAIRKNK